MNALRGTETTLEGGTETIPREIIARRNEMNALRGTETPEVMSEPLESQHQVEMR